MTRNTHIAYIGLGSNLGDRHENVRKALELIGGSNEVVKVSNSYETEPLGSHIENSGPFINAAAKISTSLTPQELLLALLDIEKTLGRPHPRPTGLARTIDLDILLYDALVLDSPAITIPHPRLSKRLFVLTPLCDIAPALVHPVLGLTMRELEKNAPPAHNSSDNLCPCRPLAKDWREEPPFKPG
ncbi:MAG: 2-amino-4-hydroxy-6-hydroxymethyldihydropteridine diphosphokinase [Pseudomonadota bacterium]